MARSLFLALPVLLGFVQLGPAGDGLPAEADVRKAIERGLPFVETDGLAWMNKRNCMSCHTVTFMLWAHNEAKAHGVPVDRAKLTEWTDWSLEKSLTTRTHFKLEAKAADTLPEAIRPKLKDLTGKGFNTEAELVAAAAKALTADELKEHTAELVKTAAVGQKTEVSDGGGLDTMSQLFLSRDADLFARNKDFFTGTADLMVRMQNPNGTWTAGGQLPARKWSKPTADQTTTMWAVLALTSYPDPSPAVQKAVEKAHAAVQTPAGDGNFEWLVARLVYLHRFGKPDQVALAKDQVLTRQNADGGWSVLADAASDAFSTGQGVYALRVAGVAADDPAVRRGQKYLLGTQGADGAWVVSPALTSKGDPARHKKLEPIWRNWGSAWAVIGLAKSLPAK